MASACALAMNSGRITYISRLSRSAERSKRYFHGKGRRGKQVALPATPLFRFMTPLVKMGFRKVRRLS